MPRLKIPTPDQTRDRLKIGPADVAKAQQMVESLQQPFVARIKGQATQLKPTKAIRGLWTADDAP